QTPPAVSGTWSAENGQWSSVGESGGGGAATCTGRLTRTRRVARATRRRIVRWARVVTVSRRGVTARFSAAACRRFSARTASSSSSSQTSPPWTLSSSGTATSKQTASNAAKNRRRNFTRPLYPGAAPTRDGGGSLRGEPVADAGLGQQIAWPGGVGLELAPQVRHVHAQVVRLLGGLRPPHLLQQLPMRDDLARVMPERHQQPVLDRREVHLCAADGHPARGEVHVQFADAEGGLQRAVRDARAVTQRHSHARHQLADAEGLGQIVVGARIER